MTHRPTPDGPDALVLLCAAADYIDVHGWIQGGFDNPAGGVCALGAIRAVAPPGPNRRTSAGEHACVTALAAHLGLVPEATTVYDVAGLVTDWNDTPGRTAGEVTSALRGAALDTGP